MRVSKKELNELISELLEMDGLVDDSLITENVSILRSSLMRVLIFICCSHYPNHTTILRQAQVLQTHPKDLTQKLKNQSARKPHKNRHHFTTHRHLEIWRLQKELSTMNRKH